MEIGDIVLINDETLPRNRWKLGKVEELITNKDGHVRASYVYIPRTGKGRF